MEHLARVFGIAQMLALLPYQLGFHPRRSLVVVAFHDRQVGVLQRLDLPAEEHVHLAPPALLPALLDRPPTAVLLVAFEDAEGESAATLRAFRDAWQDRLPLVDPAVVRGGRWWSLHCSDPACCPVDGQPLPEASRVPAVADFVLRGIYPLADRDQLARRLIPTRPMQLAAVDELVNEELRLRATVAQLADSRAAEPLVTRVRDELAVWQLVLAPILGGEPAEWEPTPRELARLAVSVQDRELRDALLAWVCPGWMDLALFSPYVAGPVRELLPRLSARGSRPTREEAELAAQVTDRLVGVCAALPDRWAPGPLCVLAWVAWWLGDGASARVALERALLLSPEYRLAALMTAMMDKGWRAGELAERERRARAELTALRAEAAGW